MNQEIKNAILAKIKEYNHIIIFRHVRPDGDCVGASKGLKEILKATYPEKEVYIIDDQKTDYLSFLGDDDGEMDESFYRSSLAIVVDTSNQERISNQKFTLCKEVVKIDHHIDHTPYGDYSWVEDQRSSACEMIVDFYNTFKEELVLTKQAATYLYTGMVTDSGRFRFSSVSGETLRLAGVLLDQGIDTETLFANLYLEDYDYYKFKAHIFNIMQRTENGVAYLYVDKAMQEQFGLSPESASATVSTMDSIRGCLCWLAFIESQEEPGTIRVRLRSRFMAINTLAEEYGGGGHACASGATVHSLDEMQALIAKADEMVKSYKETHEGWL